MKAFSGERVNEGGSDPVQAVGASFESTQPSGGDDAVAGDRGIPSINRVTSIQSRSRAAYWLSHSWRRSA